MPQAKVLKVLAMDAVIRNLKTQEMNRNHDISMKGSKKDKSLVLNITLEELSSKEDDNSNFTKIF